MCVKILLNPHEFHNFTANILAIKTRKQEELSKRITNLPSEHNNSNN